MRKLLVYFIAVSIVFSASGCGQYIAHSGEDKDKKKEAKKEEKEPKKRSKLPILLFGAVFYAAKALSGGSDKD
jgi:exopolysaccharide biosynthesis protein